MINDFQIKSFDNIVYCMDIIIAGGNVKCRWIIVVVNGIGMKMKDERVEVEGVRR